jgi:hypothetical protein
MKRTLDDLKHIPGPWRVKAHGDGTYTVETHTQTESICVDEKGNECVWSEHTLETARLISLAPEMFEALDSMPNWKRKAEDIYLISRDEWYMAISRCAEVLKKLKGDKFDG